MLPKEERGSQADMGAFAPRVILEPAYDDAEKGSGSHALRGNPSLDSPRPGFGAERRVFRSHAEHGSEVVWFSFLFLVPTLCVGTLSGRSASRPYQSISN